MTYIYPITDPEILKLGIRMALYREKKPEKSYIIPDPINVSEAIYQTDLDNWQQSRIVYLKELEFKVGDVVYYSEDYSLRVEEVKDDKILVYDIGFNNRKWFDKSDLSHYYPSQEYDGEVKYWRKKLKKEVEEDTETSFVIKYTDEWQEVEEPAEASVDYSIISGITGNEVRQKLSTNPEYTQFQAAKKSGDILAIITK